MRIGNRVGFMGKLATAGGRKGLLFALALAGMGIQGCITDDAGKKADGTESPANELNVAAQTSSKLASDGCRLYTVLDNAGSEARGQAYMSCDHKMARIGVFFALQRMNDNGSLAAQKYKYTECTNVYWCGTGNLYLPNPSGTQLFKAQGEYNKNAAGDLTEVIFLDKRF